MASTTSWGGTVNVSPREALQFFEDYCMKTMTLKYLLEYSAAHEALRRLVVDDIARRKNLEDTKTPIVDLK